MIKKEYCMLLQMDMYINCDHNIRAHVGLNHKAKFSANLKSNNIYMSGRLQVPESSSGIAAE